MKIYSKIVIDIESGCVVSEDSHSYMGPIAHLGGGNPGSTQTQRNPQVQRMGRLGEGYLNPSLQGQTLQPVTGVRSGVESFLNQSGGMFNQWNPQISQLPGQIQGFESLSPMSRDLAVRHAGDVFDPNRTTGLYNQSAQRLLSQMRPGMAARGIGTGGVAQGIENQALGNLALDFAMKESDERQRAISQLQGVSAGDLAERSGQSDAFLRSVQGGQTAISQGQQLPMQLLQQSIQTEMMPFDALTRLMGAAGGGNVIQTSRSGGGSGIFGK